MAFCVLLLFFFENVSQIISGTFLVQRFSLRCFLMLAGSPKLGCAFGHFWHCEVFESFRIHIILMKTGGLKIVVVQIICLLTESLIGCGLSGKYGFDLFQVFNNFSQECVEISARHL